MSGASAGVSGLNWRGGATAICTMSDLHGAMSLAKLKSRFGGLKAVERDQQKWNPVLRPVALHSFDCAWILTPNRPHFG
jgi:hypothetical protein